MKALKILSLLLALVTLLCACGGEAQNDQTQPTAATLAEVATQEELITALEEAPRVKLTADIQLTQAVDMRNRILDGNGHTITGMPYEEENANTENTLLVCGGTVENLNVVGGYRSLGDSREYPMGSDVRLKNVTAEAGTVAMHFGRGSKNHALFAEECTFRGWVLVNNIKDAKFMRCTFSHNSQGKNGYLRIYRNVTLTDCHFESFVGENGKVTRYNINFHSNTNAVTLTLENCYVDGTLITQDNVSNLLKLTLHNNHVVVRNTAG